MVKNETIKDIAQSIWEGRSNYVNYIQEQLDIFLNDEVKDFSNIDYKPRLVFSTVEWLSANILNNIIKQNWFRVKHEGVRKILQINHKITNFDKEITKFVKFGLAFGSFGIVRYTHNNVRKTIYLTSEEYKNFKKKYKDNIIDEKKRNGIHIVLFEKTYHNAKFEWINPYNIAFSSDFKKFLRRVYYNGNEARQITRKYEDVFNEIETGAVKYYEGYELYDGEANLYILSKDFEVIKKYKLPVKQPIVYFAPFISMDIIGYGFTEIGKHSQYFQTLFDRAMVNNVKELGETKYVYDPRVINKKELLEETEKFVSLKVPDVDPRMALVPIPKTSPLINIYGKMNEYLQYKYENITGFTRYSQGLDATSLNKTATGISLIMQASQQRVIEILNRLFAVLEHVLFIQYRYLRKIGVITTDIDKIEVIAENFDAFKEKQLQQLLQFLQIIGQFGETGASRLNLEVIISKIAKLLNIDPNEILINEGGLQNE